MNWSTKRKLTYGLSLVFAILAISFYTFRDNIFPAPTCFDKKQNSYESGVDCGGTCLLMCKQDVIPLTVKWSRALPVSPNTYDIVAMISNKNINNASRALTYLFTVYDKNGQIITTTTGSTVAPINGDFPIIKQNIKMDKMPKEVITQLFDGLHYKVTEKPTSPTVRQVNTRYEAGDIPRVFSSIINTKRVTISNLPVRAVLYDMYDNAFAVGETVIPFLDKEQMKDISFTWGMTFKQSPTRINIYPIFDPFEAVK